MILSKKKNGKGYITSYSLNIGSKEARLLGFIDQYGNSNILEKELDVNNHILIVRLKKE
ncbi:MAG: hypothetical protein HFJ20_00315 [Clostridia bacterium]|nr:hypothetical protein [Clostridia bacterium]